MQNHRICRDQFLALQSVDLKSRRLVEVERRKFLDDRIEAFDRADIVIS